MNVLFLSRLFYPHIGGVEKHVMELSRVLISQGHSVTVITEKDHETEKEIEVIHNILIIRINAGKGAMVKKFVIWKELLKKKSLFQKADVIHCHDVFFWYLPFKLVLPRKPVFTTFHGYESYPILKKAILVRKLSEKLSKGNICIGAFIQKWYGTSPTIVSYGGVTIPKRKRTTQLIKSDSAVFFGRLDEQTGIVTYTDAVTRLQKLYPDFSLLVCGEGKYASHIDSSIIVKKFQTNPQKYFSEYHFAFLSRYLSILEAFAYKKLVFAVYDNPIKEDYLKMSPFKNWIITARDEKELASKVDYFIKHPEKEVTRVNEAYTWVKDQTWEHVAKDYINLWRIASK